MESRDCPLCGTTMTYDESTGIYTCPVCGYKEHNHVLNSISTQAQG